MADHELVANDTDPPWEGYLDYDDAPYTDPSIPPLLGTETLTFVMKRSDGVSATPITGPMTVVNAATRRVRHTFTKAETATAGTYSFHVQVDYADGRRMTHPTGAPLTLVIHPDLGGPA